MYLPNRWRYKSRKKKQRIFKGFKKIGVQSEQILFQGQRLGIKDGTLAQNMNCATDWLLPFMRSLGDIENIYVPAWEGGHPDHDALHAITIITANTVGLLDRVRQFPLYNAYQCRSPFFE